jgi:hypothetical protein
LPQNSLDDDPFVDLLTAVFIRTVKDAQKGDPDAIRWLWIVVPDWADRLQLPYLEPTEQGGTHAKENDDRRSPVRPD